MLLRAHYRSTLDFSEAGIAEARKDLDRLYRALQRTPAAPGELPASVLEALCDDLNTPLAIAEMHRLADAALAGDAAASARLRAAGHLMGAVQLAPPAWFHGARRLGRDRGGDCRAAGGAKAAKNFARADAIRKELADRGILLEDGPDGTTWRRA